MNNCVENELADATPPSNKDQNVTPTSLKAWRPLPSPLPSRLPVQTGSYPW